MPCSAILLTKFIDSRCMTCCWLRWRPFWVGQFCHPAVWTPFLLVTIVQWFQKKLVSSIPSTVIPAEWRWILTKLMRHLCTLICLFFPCRNENEVVSEQLWLYEARASGYGCDTAATTAGKSWTHLPFTSPASVVAERLHESCWSWTWGCCRAWRTVCCRQTWISIVSGWECVLFYF